MKNTLLSLLGLLASASLQPAVAADGLALFQSKSCVACHAVDSKLVGPSLKDVAVKNAGVKGAADTLASHIKNGTQGNWGPIPMPANAVSDDEAKLLANWVLSLK
ncbi:MULTISPECIES: c-type cytochrome [Pseudomonas]|uniref:Cytochrome c-551 n=2 Tax=Pseudomonas TaxID=286 RepID=A0A411MI36_9PSED|nr:MULTISPECIES: c-type cytochrome [Pseudomonas]MDD1017090.1 c-type cytochrome [Pseudomonas rubra]MDD1036629.1 c-type cytochrome [Pseudomonas rubra]MDD1155991.1 c-type cytochrome [Pseudomonas rubra]QBF26477.1 c-type cytochrome [Pseudomonas tructae]